MNRLIHANALFLFGHHKKAFDTYTAILKEGPDAIAASNIGYMYHRGIGVVRNYEKARSYYSAACLDDKGVSYFNMAIMFLRGQGVEVNFKMAIDCMKRSAELGCPDARLYLGLAYILGYAYDPIEIECITLIPFYKVIYRDATAPLLMGAGDDPSLDDARYEAIEADPDEAIEMYRKLAAEEGGNPYSENQRAAAEFMIGRSYIEGLGNLYNPELGYRKLYRTAIYYDSSEAAEYLLMNAEAASAYKVDVDKIKLLGEHGYFRPVMGNLGTPKSHKVPLLLPEENKNSH